MIIETLIPTAASIGGGFFTGLLLGYFLKKIIKILMFIVGGIIGLLLYLQQQQVISLNIARLEGSSIFILTTLSSSFEKMTQIGDMSSLGIPIAASIATGFTVALTKS